MIDTDASKYQLAALLQHQDEEDPKDWKPIGFYSKTSTRPSNSTQRQSLNAMQSFGQFCIFDLTLKGLTSRFERTVKP